MKGKVIDEKQDKEKGNVKVIGKGKDITPKLSGKHTDNTIVTESAPLSVNKENTPILKESISAKVYEEGGGGDYNKEQSYTTKQAPLTPHQARVQRSLENL